MVYSINISKDLPFVPAKNTTLFVANGCGDDYLKVLSANYKVIDKIFSDYGYRFGFMLGIIENIPSDILFYYAPFLSSKPQFDCMADPVLNYIVNRDELSKIEGPALLFYASDSAQDYYEFYAFPFPEFNELTYNDLFTNSICKLFDLAEDSIFLPGMLIDDTGKAYRSGWKLFDDSPIYNKQFKEATVKESGTRFRVNSPFFLQNDLDSESEEMLGRIDELVSLLELKGFDRFCISQFISSKNDKISSMVITKDYRILLPDYNNMEIAMTPLPKALYLLFLKHLEGITLKYLPDYKDELKHLYKSIIGNGYLTSRQEQSIDALINSSFSNSVNEKCSRIREAFISKFDDRLASNYYITGKRGELKGVKLPPDLIIWEG